MITKSFSRFKFVIIILCILLPLLVAGCNRSYTNDTLAIDEVQVNTEVPDSMFVCWVTTVPSTSKIIFCSDNVCSVSDVDPNVGKLHSTVLPSKVEYFTITAIDDAGNTIEETYSP